MAKSTSNRKQTILLSLLIVGWITALLIESSQPPLPILGEVQGLDKVAHFLAFSGLGLLVCALSFKLTPNPVIPLFSMPLLIVTLFGIIEESYQMLVPGRAASLLDLLADICGALFAIILAHRAALLIRTNNPKISSD
jgi:VanZ family protein